MSTAYGSEFDKLAARWAVIENAHDETHPDRGECGGVGACSMMLTANRLEQQMIEALEQWRVVAGP
jgi:hypothetical protein